MVHHIDQEQGKNVRNGLGVIACIRGARHLVGMRRRLMVSTALMAVSCALPADAQQIDYTGNVLPLPGSSPWAVGGPLYVGETAAGTLDISSGGQITSASGVIGLTGHLFPELRARGIVTVSGTDAGGNASTWTNSGALVVGSYGDGTLIIEGGGQVLNGDGRVAWQTGSIGTVLVSGTDAGGNASTWSNSGTLGIGVGDTGLLSIEGGGLVSNTHGYIGWGEEGNGTVTVSGTDAAGNASLWANSGELFIGIEGEGELIISGGGQVTNANANVGMALGARGTVTVSGTDANGNASTWTNINGLAIGLADRGDLIVSDGGHVSSLNGTVGLNADSIGTVRIDGRDAGGNASTWTMDGDLELGVDGMGQLIVSLGGRVSNRAAYLGRNADSVGVANVFNGTWINTGDLYLGTDGAGYLNLSAGGTVLNQASQIGAGVDSLGSAVVQGAGTTWESSGSLVIGGKGVGSLTLENDGRVSAPNALIGRDAGSTGTLKIGEASGRYVAQAGVLDVGTLTFGDGMGTLVFVHRNTDYEFSTVLSSAGIGNHAIEHLAGTTLMTGDSSGFTGTTEISGGTLLIGAPGAGGKLGGSFEVHSGGILGGSGTAGSGSGSRVTVAAGGTLSPGNSIGTLTVDGDVVFEAGSRLVVEVNPAGADADLVQVTGDATLNGGAVAHIGASGDYDLRSTYTVLAADGALLGAFDGATSDFVFLTPELIHEYGAGRVDLKLLRNDIDFASAGTTRNQIATAGGIDSIGIHAAHTVYDAIARLTNDEDLIRASFDALSGEIHGSAVTALISDSDVLRSSVNDRLRSAFADDGAWLTPVLAYGPQQAPLLISADHSGPTLWTHGFGSWGQVSSDGNAAALERSVGGLLVGTDMPIGDWRVGLVAGYSQSHFTASDRSSSGSSDSYHLGLYGGTQWGDIAFRGGLAHTWHDIETNRSVSIPGIQDKLSARYGAATTQAFGELGYNIDFGEVGLEPFLNLAHTHVRTDGYSESGGAAALSSGGQNTDMTFAMLGVRGEYATTLGAIDATLIGMIGWSHVFGDTAPQSTHAFSAGNAFTIAGTPIAKNSAVIEAGLDLSISPEAKFGLSYSGQIASSATDHGFKAALSVSF